MSIKSNKELSDAIDKVIEESGYKRIYIADKLGIANQNLKKAIHKQNISIDDTNKILDIVGYEATISIQKKLNNQ